MDSGTNHPYRDNGLGVAHLKAEVERERYRAKVERKNRRREHRRKHGQPRRQPKPTVRVTLVAGTFFTKVPLLDQHSVELLYVVIIITLVKASLAMALRPWP